MRHIMLFLCLVAMAATHASNAEDVQVTKAGSAVDSAKVFRDCPECPEMVIIPSGEFNMGSPANEAWRYENEGPVHRVTVPSFALAKTELTQGQWKALMDGNPSFFTDCGDDCPVEQVTWDEAKAYVDKLSKKTGHKYRLPNEAEWEYACRAGGQATYCGGDQLDELGWYNVNSGYKTHAVAGKKANAFGLYDMTGNVWEWLDECWHDNYSGAHTDGVAWAGGDCGYRLLRGGSWNFFPKLLRAAIRYKKPPPIRNYITGFRPAMSLDP